MTAPYGNLDQYVRELERRLEGVPRRGRILAEVSDHLQAIVEEERAAGRAGPEAEREAMLRCGEPAAVARPFLRRPPLYLMPKARYLVAGFIATTVIKALLIATVPQMVFVYDLDGNVELRRRTLLFLGLCVVVAAAQLCRWAVLKGRGTLVEVSSATGVPDWHRRARPWLAAAALAGFALACIGLWAPQRWASAAAALAGLVFIAVSVTAARRHFWRQAIA